MYTYTVFKEDLHTENDKPYSSFGIKVLNSDGKEVCSVSDISPNEMLVNKLCNECTKNQLSPIHLHDVIEDSI